MMHAETLAGWLLDLLLGDPAWLPHPVVGFGKLIARGEHRLNQGRRRRLKGGVMAVALVGSTFAITAAVLTATTALCPPAGMLLRSILIFFCLAGTTLVREVKAVFLAVDRSLDEGRRQVARIVGRDTAALSAQEVRTAALETLAENLSDGVVAPLFWLSVAGVPGMMAYKMVNTLDSMIGYRTDRYRLFGCVAARMDDAANWVPARLTALLMALAGLSARRSPWATLCLVRRNGPKHASPNSGYPEAALAAILDCRFGGPHHYFGQLVEKPYIGERRKTLGMDDMKVAIRVNRLAELMAVGLALWC